MITDDRMERLYERVRLVRGKGHRDDGNLCVMTFVAWLAGERHSDAPRTASPLIRDYAIALNDALPDAERQSLKPFAPRIIGTHDGHDASRGALLRRALEHEVLPRLRADLRADVLPWRLPHDWMSCGTGHDIFFNGLGWALDVLTEPVKPPSNDHQLARLIATLLPACAASASTKTAGRWYTAKAIDLLDRLCDVGIPNGHAAIAGARVAQGAVNIYACQPIQQDVSRRRQVLHQLGKQAARLIAAMSSRARSCEDAMAATAARGVGADRTRQCA